MTGSDNAAYGVMAPGRFDRAILALTSRLPDNWLGLRLAILLRRAVTTRLDYPDGALDVERWGLRVRLHPRDNGCEKNLLFTPQMYEPTELRELAVEIARAKLQQRPFVFVDIGANVGLFSLFVASQAGRDARILAIEPEAGNLRRLHFNVDANPDVRIKVVPTALSDEAGELAIEPHPRDRGGSRTIKLVPSNAADGAARVPSQTLLQLLTQERVEAVDALKIDVEGFEDIILCPFFEDAPPTIWPRLIIIEDGSGSWGTDLVATMMSKGYAIAARTRLNLILRRNAA
jgi:FkbM family methyltransferase